MTKPNFATMTTAELKQYVIKHRSDDEAFYALADRVHLEGTELASLDQLTEIIQSKQKTQERKPE